MWCAMVIQVDPGASSGGQAEAGCRHLGYHGGRAGVCHCSRHMHRQAGGGCGGRQRLWLLWHGGRNYV